VNEVLTNREFLINRDNDGILKELLSYAESFNTLWGPEYIIMNEKHFIENNANEIIEIMVKSKAALSV
jgi:hypothetical protein